MSLWSWYRKRGWLGKPAIGFPIVLVAVAALYVVSRALQYASAEKEIGPFIPSGANVVLRSSNLEEHWGRIQKSDAWRTIRRKFLKDPFLRKRINGALKEADLPTLDDLEDVRKPHLVSEELLLRVAGRDAMAAFQVEGSWSSARMCAAARLRFGDFLLAPFAKLFFPSENVGGESGLCISVDKSKLYAVLAGSVVVVSDDRALLADALKRAGKASGTSRPIEGRILFEGSPAALEARNALRDSGLFPYVKLDSAVAAGFSLDIGPSALLADVTFEGARPAREGPPPGTPAVPAACAGRLSMSAGPQDVYAWLGPLARSSKGLRDILDELESAGLSSRVLPRFEGGMMLLAGGEEDKGRLYPGIALILPCPEPQRAFEEVTGLIGKLVNSPGEFVDVPGTQGLRMWRWPGLFKKYEFLRLCCGVVDGAFVFGTSLGFTRAVLETAAGQSGGFQDQADFRSAQKRLKEYGMTAESSPAGLIAFPPFVKDYLDGVIPTAAEWIVDSTNMAVLRAQKEAEQRQQGRSPTSREVDQLVYDELHRKYREEEDSMRDSLQILEGVRWAAMEARAQGGAVALRLALELR